MMSQLLLAGSEPLVVVDSADFDGTNDYMTRGAGLDGAADSKTGIISFWMRVDGGDSSTLRILGCANSVGGALATGFRNSRASDNTINAAFGSNAAGTNILSLPSTNSTHTTSATWKHILASWNLAVTTGYFYINDVAQSSGSTVLTDDTIDYTKADWSVGAAPNGADKVNGCLAEFYFAPGQYLDFSIVANRRRFISGSGKPIFLGTTGAIPTGTAAIDYHHLDDGEAVANFATNRGTGGNFTITGTLETGSTSPSD